MDQVTLNYLSNKQTQMSLTGSFVHAAVPVDICKDMELGKGNVVTAFLLQQL